MRKHIGFTLFALALVIVTFFLTDKVIDAAKEDQLRFMNKLSRTRELNAELDGNLFRFSQFKLKNYDQLVSHTHEMKMHSGFLKLESPNYSSEVTRFAAALDRAIDRKAEAMEKFKSKNAVLRNSYTYLSTLGEEIVQRSLNHPAIKKDSLIHFSWLLHTYLRNRDTENLRACHETLNTILRRLPARDPLVAQLQELDVHLKILETNEGSARSFYNEATSLDINHRIQDLAVSYQGAIRAKNSITVWYQRAMFAILLVVFGYCVFILVGLWKTMKRLEESNNHLEERVHLRTQELEESAAIIKSQQKSLIHSSKMSALGEMAGGIAHEINNPLAIITINCKTLTKRLMKDDLKPGECLEQVKQIQDTVDRISSIVKGLRTFSREGVVSDMKKVGLQQVIDETLTLCQDKFHANGIRLEKSLSGDLPPIECNPVSLSQVLLNLLNNSCDAISAMDEKWVRIEAVPGPQELQISITDSGKGIPAEIANKLMQPFFTTKEVGKGTGLGLSISKGIIEGHGGKFALDPSYPNTRFVIQIPYEQIKAA